MPLIAPGFYHVSLLPDIYMPLAWERTYPPPDTIRDMYANPSFAWLSLMGRLKPGVTPQQAERASAAWFSGLAEESRGRDRRRTAHSAHRCTRHGADLLLPG